MPLQTIMHSCARKIRALAVVSMAVLFCFFTGCTPSSIGQKGDISFCIDSATAQQILGLAAGFNSSRAAASVTEDNLKTAVISVSLKGDYEETKTKDFSSNGVSLSFSKVPIGAHIFAQAEIYYIDSNNTKVQICSGESDSIVVQDGKNSLSIDLTVVIEKAKEEGNQGDPENPEDTEKPVEREYCEYKNIIVNDNWHLSIFNEYLDVVTCKEATATSITFTLNHELNSADGMLQVVFGDSAYVEGKSYVCSYQIQGPVPDGATGHEMNVCCWVTKTQANRFSTYNSTSPTETSFSMTCDTTEKGGLLFFPEIPGEYTISDVAVIEVDPSAQEITPCSIEIKAAEAPAFEDIQVNIVRGNESIVFTAPEGFASYDWQLKCIGEVIQTSNTNELVIEVSSLTKDLIYDLTLFADNKSYAYQIKISE